MGRFLVDEDLPRSLATTLQAGGTSAEDVRDVGLRGATDDDVLAHAVVHGLTLVTGDLDFANLLRFPLGTHRGIVVARLPHQWAATRRTQIIADAVRDLPDDVLLGCLIIVEPGRIRLRRPG
jgi:predicted nuclease of predicted toxin-antitoxin system